MHTRLSFRFASLQSTHCFGSLPVLRLHPQSHRFAVIPHLRRCYASGKRSKLPPPSSPSSTSRSAPAVKQLAQDEHRELYRLLETAKNGRAELYDPGSGGAYIFVIWATATFCFLYAAINAQLVFVDTAEQRSRKEKVYWGALCLFMVGGGALALNRGKNLITGMSLVQKRGEPRIEIKVRRLVPFRKERRVLTSLDQITYRYRLLPPQPQSAALYKTAKMMARSAVGTDYLEAVRQENATSFSKNPGRKISMTIWQCAQGVKLLFNPNGFVKLSIEGEENDLQYPLGGRISPEYVLLSRVLKIRLRKDMLSRLVRWLFA